MWTQTKKLRVTRDSCAKERSFTNEQELNKNGTKWRLHVSHKWSPRNVTHSKMDTIKILQVQHNWKLLLNLSVPHTEFPFSWPNLNLQNTSNLLADNCTRSRGFTNIMDSLHSFPPPPPPVSSVLTWAVFARLCFRRILFLWRWLLFLWFCRSVLTFRFLLAVFSFLTLRLKCTYLRTNQAEGPR